MNKPTINSSLQSPRYLDKVDDLTAGLDKLRPGTGGAINFLLRDAYEEGRKAAELGDGEPSSAAKSLHCAWHGTDTCGALIIPDAYSYSGYSHFRRTDPAGQKIDWLHWASPIPHGIGAEETMRIFIPCIVCGKTGPDNENHIKYKKAGGHKFKCRSGAAQEVSPPSPELVTKANDLLRRLNKEVFSDAVDMYRLPEAVGWVIDFAKENGGDTRELKAALHKLRPFAYKAESVDCYRCRECHAQGSEFSKIVHDADCEVGEAERLLG